MSVHERPLVTGVNGTPMARGGVVWPALMAAPWFPFDNCHPSGRGPPRQGSQSDRVAA